MLGCSLALGQRAEPAAGTTDDRFIADLATGARDEPVDRKRLADFFAGLAAKLGSERQAVEVLQRFTSVPEAQRHEVTDRLAQQYGEYSRSVESFLHSSAELAGEPNSRLSFYRVFLDGFRPLDALDPPRRASM